MDNFLNTKYPRYMEKLKELRKINNLRQKDVAEFLNISITGYASWEQGLSEPNIENLIKLADFYNTTVDYLINREEEDGRIIIQEPELLNDEKNLLTNYRKLPTDLKESAQEYLKSLNNINIKHNNK